MSERAIAKAEGRKQYFTGRPCPQGHIDFRYTSGGGCVACLRDFARSDHKKKYDKQYYDENRDRIKIRGAVYSKINAKAIQQKVKIWQDSNPEKVRAIKNNYKHRRRTKEKAGVSSLEFQKWQKEQKKICYWCGAKCHDSYHIDHYDPLSKGGRHELDNMVISCAPCNLTKNAKDPYFFAQTKGKLF